MRTLLEPPTSVVDARTGALNTGSFRGTLPRVDLGPLGKGTLYRLTHLKKWLYLAIASDDLFVGLALVDLGYVVSTFGFAFDRASKKMLVDRSALGHGKVGHVSDTVGEGFEARFARGKTHVDFT